MSGIAKWREGIWEKRYELIVGLVLCIVITYALAQMVIYLLHSDAQKARLVKLPIPVQVLPATVSQLQESIGAAGIIQPSVYITMTAKVTGRVVKVPVDLGTIVKPGGILVQLDDSLYAAKLNSAKETYDHASRQLERMEKLLNDNLGSAVEVELARIAKANARQSMVAAEIDLANTLVRSPALAVVLNRTVNPGEFTRLDQSMIELGVIRPVMMVAGVAEDQIGSVHLGMTASVGTDAFAGETFTGQVVKIGARVSDTTRTFDVYIELHNQDLRLKPGVTGYARLESRRAALAIPSTALMNPLGDRATTFVVDSGHRAHLREVRRGPIVGGMTEVLGGLRAGEQVVTVGQLELRDNDLVSVNQFGPWNLTVGTTQ